MPSGRPCVFAPWIASYTETVEEKNPALVATGLALWGWSLRIVVGLSFIFLPLVITSVNPIVDNLPVADTVIHGQSISDFVAENPAVIAFASSHGALLALLAKDPAAAAAVAADPSAANIAAAEKAFGAAGLAELAKYKTQLAKYVQPYSAQLAYIQGHQAALKELQAGSAKAPSQWQHWFYVDLAGIIVFVPDHLAGQGPMEAVGGPPRRRRAQCRGGRRAGPSHRGTARQHLSAGRSGPSGGLISPGAPSGADFDMAG